MKYRFPTPTVILVLALAVFVQTGQAWAAPPKQPEIDKRYYVIEDIPTPEGVVFEASAIARIPHNRLAVATRRGDIYLLDNPFGPVNQMKFTHFAMGLEEPLGLVWKDGWLYASEHTQVVRVADLDGNDIADAYETFCNDWGCTPGTYHEFSWLAPPDKDGNFWVALCLTNSGSSGAYMRGWAVRVTPDGVLIPSVAGVRSPGGIGYSSDGELFYNDNQGLWNGTSGLKHLKIGSHQGNPNGNKWYEKARKALADLGIPDYLGPDPGWPKDPYFTPEERKRNPKYLPPAILYPHGILANSPTGIVYDNSEGKFGPFAGQMFVGEITQSKVLRIYLEEVNGIMQGAVFPFIEGCRSGPVGVLMVKEGFIFTGETDRGWGSRGGEPFALERIRWTGEVPLEIHEMRIEPDGFTLTFTKPVDPKTAGDVQSYAMRSWTYHNSADYGSPELQHTKQTITAAEVAEDGLSVRLTIEGITLGHLHELKLEGVRAAEDPNLGLWHPVAYYTVNEIPSKNAHAQP